MTLSRDRTGLDPSKLPDWREDPGSIPPGAKPLYIRESASGLAIEDGSVTRSFVTAEVSAGVPTGNFS
jgi:hypothetical protein